LQKPNTDKDYFCSINPWQAIDEDKIVKRIKYRHPLFTIENFALQERLQELNKDTRIFFAGAYFGYGFHEDALRSAVRVADRLDVQPPWVAHPARQGAA
jgi:predicted NAD/FAD-binding protein